MKYVIVIEDGASDYPIEEIDGKTPLKIANKPVLDKIAREGKTGLIQNVPETLPPGSDVANMSIFGYDPLEYYTGRGPLEAASMGVETKEGDVVFRCNTITERDGLMASSNAGHISSEEAAELMEALNEYFNDKYPDFKGKFYPGVSYRHLFVYNDKENQARQITHLALDIYLGNDLSKYKLKDGKYMYLSYSRIDESNVDYYLNKNP